MDILQETKGAMNYVVIGLLVLAIVLIFRHGKQLKAIKDSLNSTVELPEMVGMENEES